MMFIYNASYTREEIKIVINQPFFFFQLCETDLFAAQTTEI